MNRTDRRIDRRRGERGVITLLYAAFGLTAMGALGLALDLGRMYVVRNELQTFTDAAALAAAHHLDGTQNGFQAARNRVDADPNRWNFGTEAADAAAYQVEFSFDADGPFEANPATAVNYRYVRVRAQAPVGTTFTRIFPGVPADAPVASMSVAGQEVMPFLGDGVIPFSPDAHNPNDPTGNYGFRLGEYYTLRWEKATGNPQPGTYLESLDGEKLIGCSGDMAAMGSFNPGATNSSERGYIDLGDLGPSESGGGANLIKNIILSKVSFSQSITPYSYWVSPEPGQKQVITGTLADRVQEDTDPVTPRYYTQAQTAPGVPSREEMNTLYRDETTYWVGEPRPPLGNGRRVVVAPVNDPVASSVVIGFGGFFLPPQPCGVGNNNPCCAEYIGPVTRWGQPAAGGGAGGVYQVVLVR